MGNAQLSRTHPNPEDKDTFAAMNAWEARLVQRLAAPLPGREAQFRMASSMRVPPGAYEPDVSRAKTGAVLIAIYPKDGALHTVLMKRPQYDGAHSGQVSFPGGRQEPTDRDLAHTALREAQEEVGLAPEGVRLAGRLTELFIPASNFLVHPIIGLLSDPPLLRPDPQEVERILNPPLSVFFDDSRIGTRSMTVREGLMIRTPYFDVEGDAVWGATAMIIAELKEVIGELGLARP